MTATFTKEQLQAWAETRADDAGRVARFALGLMEENERLKARYESDVPRAGPVLARVRELIASRGKVTSRELCEIMPEVKPKMIHNSLGYLCRRKLVQHLGYGKYAAILGAAQHDKPVTLAGSASPRSQDTTT